METTNLKSNAFTAGIKPGGLTNDFEVKILICFLLDNMKDIITTSQLQEVVAESGFVNYFELAEAISELRASEHIICLKTQSGEEILTLSETGIKTSKAFSDTLPATVKEKTLELCQKKIQYKKRKDEIDVSYEKVSDGYQLKLSFKDIGTDLLNMKIFIPTEKQCAEIKEQIYRNPTIIYSGILSLLLGNYTELYELASEQIIKGNDAVRKDGQIY